MLWGVYRDTCEPVPLAEVFCVRRLKVAGTPAALGLSDRAPLGPGDLVSGSPAIPPAPGDLVSVTQGLFAPGNLVSPGRETLLPLPLKDSPPLISPPCPSLPPQLLSPPPSAHKAYTRSDRSPTPASRCPPTCPMHPSESPHSPQTPIVVDLFCSPT